MNSPRLNNNNGPLNELYIRRSVETINRALTVNPRTMAIRIDLRLPEVIENHFDFDAPPEFYNIDLGMITRFFSSLQSQIKHDLDRKRNRGIRVHDCDVRYVWVMEFSKKKNKLHYHVLLLLNNDTYFSLGDCRDIYPQNNLISKIRKAWASALNGSYESCMYLVHVPDNPIVHLDCNSSSFGFYYDELIYRVSYMAKDKSKHYCKEYRSFGCSQR